MARDEVFKTEEKKLMETTKTVQELIRENNLSLTFYSELEKSISKETSEEKQTTAKKKTQKTVKNENSKYYLQEKMKIQKKKRRCQPKKYLFHQWKWQTAWNRKILY